MFCAIKAEEIAKYEGVDLVLGATEKFKLPHILTTLANKKLQKFILVKLRMQFFESAYSIGDRTRAFLKVQDGCDYKCTYCTIPLARGISRSDQLENILKMRKKYLIKRLRKLSLPA